MTQSTPPATIHTASGRPAPSAPARGRTTVAPRDILLRRNILALLPLAVLLAACASTARVDATEAIRQVDGDVAVLAVFVRGEDVARSEAVATQVRAQVTERFGDHSRSAEEIRAAIAAQLEGAALRPSDRQRILLAAEAVDADPARALAVLRDHRAATVVDRDLRTKARSLFLRAATEALARGDQQKARDLLAELYGWFSYTAPPPGDVEVPRAVRTLWDQVVASTRDTALYEHTLPFLSLLPHGFDHLALATSDVSGLAPDVIEQAARLGTALRLDKVILAGMVQNRARAFVVDVSTRACLRSWTLSKRTLDAARSAWSD